MTRNWESVYANLGDVTDCLRDAISTLRKEVPKVVPGTARASAPAIDVKTNLEQSIALIQEIIRLVEQNRSDFYLSHTPEVKSTRPQPNFLFGNSSIEI